MYSRKTKNSLMHSKRFLAPVLREISKEEGREAFGDTDWTPPYGLLPLPYRRLVRLIFSSSDLPVLLQ